MVFSGAVGKLFCLAPPSPNETRIPVEDGAVGSEAIGGSTRFCDFSTKSGGNAVGSPNRIGWMTRMSTVSVLATGAGDVLAGRVGAWTGDLISSLPLIFITTLPLLFEGKMSDIRGGTGKLEKPVAGNFGVTSIVDGMGNRAAGLFTGGKSKAGGSICGGGNKSVGAAALVGDGSAVF